jgi:Protein of unknown function (DUF4236)
MSFRFRKRIRLGKFSRVNLSKSGASLSVAKRGATVNVGAPQDYGHRRNTRKRRQLSDWCRQAPIVGRTVTAGDRHRGRTAYRGSLVAVRAVITPHRQRFRL